MKPINYIDFYKQLLEYIGHNIRTVHYNTEGIRTHQVVKILRNVYYDTNYIYIDFDFDDSSLTFSLEFGESHFTHFDDHLTIYYTGVSSEFYFN